MNPIRLVIQRFFKARKPAAGPGPQLTLFGGGPEAPHAHAATPPAAPAGTVEVRTHLAANPHGGGVHVVHEHQRHVQPAAAGEVHAGQTLTGTVASPHLGQVKEVTRATQARAIAYHDVGSDAAEWEVAQVKDFHEGSGMPVFDIPAGYEQVTTRWSKPGEPFCQLCGTKIKNFCWIVNHKKRQVMGIGTTCVEKHQEILDPFARERSLRLARWKIKPDEVAAVNSVIQEGYTPEVAVAIVRAERAEVKRELTDEGWDTPSEELRSWWKDQQANYRGPAREKVLQVPLASYPVREEVVRKIGRNPFTAPQEAILRETEWVNGVRHPTAAARALVEPHLGTWPTIERHTKVIHPGIKVGEDLLEGWNRVRSKVAAQGRKKALQRVHPVVQKALEIRETSWRARNRRVTPEQRAWIAEQYNALPEPVRTSGRGRVDSVTPDNVANLSDDGIRHYLYEVQKFHEANPLAYFQTMKKGQQLGLFGGGPGEGPRRAETPTTAANPHQVHVHAHVAQNPHGGVHVVHEHERKVVAGRKYEPGTLYREGGGKATNERDAELRQDLTVYDYFKAGSPGAVEHLGAHAEDVSCVRCGAKIRHVFQTDKGPMGGDCLATLTGDDSSRRAARVLLDSLDRWMGTESLYGFKVQGTPGGGTAIVGLYSSPERGRWEYTLKVAATKIPPPLVMGVIEHALEGKTRPNGAEYVFQPVFTEADEARRRAANRVDQERLDAVAADQREKATRIAGPEAFARYYEKRVDAILSRYMRGHAGTSHTLGRVSSIHDTKPRPVFELRERLHAYPDDRTRLELDQAKFLQDWQRFGGRFIDAGGRGKQPTLEFPATAEGADQVEAAERFLSSFEPAPEPAQSPTDQEIDDVFKMLFDDIMSGKHAEESAAEQRRLDAIKAEIAADRDRRIPDLQRRIALGMLRKARTGAAVVQSQIPAKGRSPQARGLVLVGSDKNPRVKRWERKGQEIRPDNEPRPPTEEVSFRHPDTGETRQGKVISGGARGVTVVDHETGQAHKVAHGQYVSAPVDQEEAPPTEGANRPGPRGADHDWRKSHPGLSRYPGKDVKPDDVEEGKQGDAWRLRWRHPTTGKVQLAYDPATLKENQRAKFHRMRGFGQALPAFRETVGHHLELAADSESAVLGAMATVLDQAYLRPGGEGEEHKGLTDLTAENVSSIGDLVRFTFTGKAGVPQEHEIRNAAVAGIVRHLLADGPGEGPLFQFRKGDRWTPVTAGRLNDYLAANANGATAKDFRTWHATRIFSEEADRLGPPRDEKDADEKVERAAQAVAVALGHKRGKKRGHVVEVEGPVSKRVVTKHGGQVLDTAPRGRRHVAFHTAKERKAFQGALGEAPHRVLGADEVKDLAIKPEWEHESSTSLENYIDPTVVAAYRQGLTLSGGSRQLRKGGALTPEEQRFTGYLERVAQADPLGTEWSPGPDEGDPDGQNEKERTR